MLRFGILLFVLISLSACTLFTKPGNLHIVDDTKSLDQARISRAAQPLLEQGSNLALILVEQGDDDALPALQRLGMLQNESILERSVAIYISMQPHYSELRVGQPWSESLPPERLRELRLNVLNPALQAGEPTAAIEATLAVLTTEIAGHEARTARIWQLGLGAVGLFLSFIALKIFSPTIETSAFGQALIKLWERTPIGTAQAHKRIQQQIAQSRIYLNTSRQHAHDQLTQLHTGKTDLSTELKALDARYLALQQRSHDPTLTAELGELRQAYEQWLGRLRAVQRDERNLEHSAHLAQSTLQRLERTFQNMQNSTIKRKRKTTANITEQHKTQLAELGLRYAALEQEWKSHTFEDSSPHATQTRQNLLAAFSMLDQQLRTLWQQALPREYANFQREQSQTYVTGMSDSTNSDSSSWSSSSDSSSWSSSSDSSSRSDSSNGGSW